MMKKLTIIFLTIIFILCFPITTLAYEPNDFTVSAEAGILVSLDTGEVLYEKNVDKKVYPASITKIMTVLLILESDRFDPNAKIAMREDVNPYITGTGSAVSTLRVGEEISQLDLVYYVLMSSAGDCAYLAALHYGDTVENFVSMMNQRAAQLGLTGTHYGNPVGLHDEETYTTVRDVRILAEHALKNETFKTVCSSDRYEVPPTNMSGKRILSTTNFMIDKTTNYYYKPASGVKTGFTNQAGRCLVSTASYNGYNYLCVLMKCPNEAGKRHEFIDSANLYRWAFNNFELKSVVDTEAPVGELPVELSLETDFVPLYVKNKEDCCFILPNEADESTIKLALHLDSESVDAPIEKNQVLGTADIIYAEKILGTVELVAGNSVKQSKLLLIARTLKDFFSSVYMKIVYILIVVGIIIFIIMVIKLNSGRSKKRKVKYIPYSQEKGKKHYD